MHNYNAMAIFLLVFTNTKHSPLPTRSEKQWQPVPVVAFVMAVDTFPTMLHIPDIPCTSMM
jgi:hypothetical protein